MPAKSLRGKRIMKIETRHPISDVLTRAPKPGLEPKLFSGKHGISEDVARRIISISINAIRLAQSPS